MWLAFKALRLFSKSLLRIAKSLEELTSLYKLDLATRGIIFTDPTITDQVEVTYGYNEPERE